MCTSYLTLLQALSASLGSRLKTVVLFGSRARGEASPDSDHDIFVVARGLPADPLGRARQLRGALIDCLADLPGAINLHGKTPREFEMDLAPLYLEICVDGICLHGEDYFEPLRQRALAALASSGMERRRVGGNLFWMFPG
jgi:predicted nucleotidyltransferase